MLFRHETPATRVAERFRSSQAVFSAALGPLARRLDERRRELEGTVARYASPGRLEAGDAVREGREADGAAGIGPERSEAEAGGEKQACEEPKRWGREEWFSMEKRGEKQPSTCRTGVSTLSHSQCVKNCGTTG